MSNETMMTEASADQATEGQATSQTTETQTPVVEGEGQSQQATEGQTAEGQQAEGEQSEGDKAKPEGAPEQYEFKAPEGREFDSEVIAKFSEVAKELNLSQEAAQKVLDKVAPTIEARNFAVLEAARNQWAESARADKEFGGDALNENLAVAKRALDTFATPELRTLLNESGLGNHPEVIRMFYRAGKAISEDGRLVTGAKGNASGDQAKRLFPDMN